MRSIPVAILAVLLALSAAVPAADFLLTFQPALTPGADTLVTQWDEKDMRLSISPAANNMSSRDNGYQSWPPSNGTAFIAFKSTAVLQPAVLTNTAGITFSLKHVDLAEYSSQSMIYVDVEFVGYRGDGSTVTNVFVMDKIIDGDGITNDWERFTFSAGFTNLTHVEISQPGMMSNESYSMDNIRVGTIVTNPASIAGISATGGIATLTVADLSMMASNLVERSHDLVQSNWTAASWFVSSNATEQWSEPISNSWTNVFYRVRSR
ncbi:hypothetical protein ACFLQU_04585 [Verrucomicrobiota bacterium]